MGRRGRKEAPCEHLSSGCQGSWPGVCTRLVGLETALVSIWGSGAPNVGREAMCLDCPSTGSLRPLESLPVEASLSFIQHHPSRWEDVVSEISAGQPYCFEGHFP